MRAPGRTERAADVLLVTLDDVARVDLDNLLASGMLPNLAELAAEGTRFRQLYSSLACSQGRYCEHTGELGRRRDVLGSLDPWEWPGRRLPAGVITIAEVARSAGYTTGLFGKYHLGGPLLTAPTERGFDVWRAGTPTNIGEGGGTGYGAPANPPGTWFRVDDGVGNQSNVYATSAQLYELGAWWNTVHGPKFAALALNVAHSPLHCPPPSALPSWYRCVPTNPGRFEAMLVTVDTALRWIRTQLVGIADAWVLLTADNGTASNVLPPKDPDVGRAKGTPWQRGILVGALVRAPGGKGGGREDEELRHLTDFWATLRAITGAPLVPPSDSRALFASGHDYVISEALLEQTLPHELRRAVIRSDGWKLHDTPEGQLLFYLPKDPLEHEDRHAGEPLIVAELSELLESG